VEWVGLTPANNKEVSDTTNSVSFPAYLVTRPPVRSVASFWLQPGGGNVFTLTAPTGSIIDVNLSLIFQDDNTSLAQSNVTTGVLTSTYYLSLDPNATHRYVPVSLTTTT
jgi:hypothetical protein